MSVHNSVNIMLEETGEELYYICVYEAGWFSYFCGRWDTIGSFVAHFYLEFD